MAWVVYVIVFGSQSADKKMQTVSDKQWWKEAVVYQIYPGSFKDSDGDGIGDLKTNTNTKNQLVVILKNLWSAPNLKALIMGTHLSNGTVPKMPVFHQDRHGYK